MADNWQSELQHFHISYRKQQKWNQPFEDVLKNIFSATTLKQLKITVKKLLLSKHAYLQLKLIYLKSFIQRC